jgi:alkylation response protein AidB-like acyl-CoA dehydrogenase
VDFRLDDEQVALQEAVAGFGASRYPLTSVADREAAPLTRESWGELADLGVFSLLAPSADGGLDLGLVDAVLVFEQLGRHLVSGPTWWSTAAAPALLGAHDSSSIVGGFDETAAFDGLVLVEHAAELDRLVVLRRDGLFVIERDALPEPRPAEPLDPLTPVGAFDTLPTGERIGGVDAAEELRVRATVLVAALLLGISEAALAVARDYALEREQFGQPIGTFQALKHLMADMFVRTSLARSATYAAAAVVDDPVVGHGPRSVSGAKLLAGEAAIENSRAAVQVLGGMGFTWEMPPNHLLKRAWVLEHAFGSSAAHAASISASIASESA